MRQVVLDTETTGIGAESGHRIIEIGCIELVDRQLTGAHYHTYLNPDRTIDPGAFRVHGIHESFLSDKPGFKQIIDPLLSFIDQAELIIHNAPFDVAFLNAELKRAERTQRVDICCTIFDTLVWAKKKHPGQRNSLDALCKRYSITRFNRDLHGALLDAEILAHLYLTMTGGQAQLFTEETNNSHTDLVGLTQNSTALSSCSPVIYANAEERRAHEDFTRFVANSSGINYLTDAKIEHQKDDLFAE